VEFLFYFAHPAQFLFARNSVRRLKKSGHQVHVLIKGKDVLEDLISGSGIAYHNILPEKRGNSKLAILYSLLKRNLKLISFLRNNKTDVLIGTDASIAQVGKLFGKETITILEDDYDIIRQLAKLTYPYTKHILVPYPCEVGPYEHKKIGYPGYMKLAYLGPGLFKPDRSIVNLPEAPYFLLRLSALQAHHDEGVKGLNDQVLLEIIQKLNRHGNVYISSEKELKPDFEQYRLQLNPADIHHYLYFSEMFVSDSQSMSVESALLGVPSIRVSDFAGRISVLNELEDDYQLTFGIKPGDNDALMGKLEELLFMENRKNIFHKRRFNMLSEKIDVSEFFTWFLMEYPQSVDELKKNPDYVDRFKYDQNVLDEIRKSVRSEV